MPWYKLPLVYTLSNATTRSRKNNLKDGFVEVSELYNSCLQNISRFAVLVVFLGGGFGACTDFGRGEDHRTWAFQAFLEHRWQFVPGHGEWFFLPGNMFFTFQPLCMALPVGTMPASVCISTRKFLGN